MRTTISLLLVLFSLGCDNTIPGDPNKPDGDTGLSSATADAGTGDGSDADSDGADSDGADSDGDDSDGADSDGADSDGSEADSDGSEADSDGTEADSDATAPDGDDPGDAGGDTDGGDDDGDGGDADDSITTDDGSPIDEDGDDDGYTSLVDCDDTDPLIHPGADEVCDGRDNDCDGMIDTVDDSLTGALTVWPDLDGDGFGGSADSELSCTVDAGWSTESGDCNDDDPDIHPDADEVCDAIDNDCDTLTDNDDDDTIGLVTFYLDSDDDDLGTAAGSTEACPGTPPEGYADNTDDCDDSSASVGAATAWYADDDGDSYGAGEAVFACDAPAGTSSVDTDCNDSASGVHPGATDYCGDDIDNDCDDHPTDWASDCINFEPQDVLPLVSCTGDPESFSVNGDYIRVTYGDDGFWWDLDEPNGLQIRPADRAPGDDEWAEVTHVGTSIDQMTLDLPGEDLFFSGGHENHESSDFTLTCANPVSMGDVIGAVHKFEASWMSGTILSPDGFMVPTFSSVNITRTELWNRAGEAMLVHFDVTRPLYFGTTSFTLRRQIDPDIDSPDTSHTAFYGNTDYENYVSASGPSSDWTVGWGGCSSDGKVGALDSLDPVDEDVSGACRSDGITGDMMLTYLWNDTIPSMDSIEDAFGMTIGADVEGAEDQWMDQQEDLCGDLFDHSWLYSWASVCEPIIFVPWDPPDWEPPMGW